MSVVKLLLNRLALSRGVGITTRENRHLPPIADLPAIPARTGKGNPHLRKPLVVAFDAIGPLTETAYAARTYHPDRRSYSHDGLFSLPLEPIKTINVTSGDAVPKSLTIALSDETTAAPAIGGALRETSRTWTLTNTRQKFKILTDFWVAFDARLDDITFSRSGKIIKLILYPTGAAATVYATIFGTHTLSSVTLTSYKLMALYAKTATTDKKFALILKSPGKLFEFAIKDSVLTTILSFVNNTVYFPWPWQSRVKDWGLSHGFKTLNGLLYTDETLATRADSETYPTLSTVNLLAAPRYFRFSAASDYTIPSTSIKMTKDAIFQANTAGHYFCGPTAISSGITLPIWQHLFKCRAGPVWAISVDKTNGTGSSPTDLYTVTLGYRYDPVLDYPGYVGTVLATVNATNYANIWSAIPVTTHRNAPAITSPSKRPVSLELVSAPDGKSCVVIGYWNDGTYTADKPKLPTSIILLEFTETGDADPVTGAGISCAATQVPVLESWTHTPKPEADSYTYPANHTLTDDIIGMCGADVMHSRRSTYMTAANFSNPGNYSNRDLAETTYYSAIHWIYPYNNESAVYPAANNDFDIIYIKGSIVTSGHFNDVDTYFHDHHEDHICTDGFQSTHQWDDDVAIFTGDILQDETTRTYLESSRVGIISDATMVLHFTRVWVSGADFPGTEVSSVTDQASGSACSVQQLIQGASYAYPQNHRNSPSTDFKPTNKLVRGYAVPVDTSNNLVCIDPRHNRAYIAPNSASSGVFY